MAEDESLYDIVFGNDDSDGELDFWQMILIRTIGKGCRSMKLTFLRVMGILTAICVSIGPARSVSHLCPLSVAIQDLPSISCGMPLHVTTLCAKNINKDKYFFLSVIF